MYLPIISLRGVYSRYIRRVESETYVEKGLVGSNLGRNTLRIRRNRLWKGNLVSTLRKTFLFDSREFCFLLTQCVLENSFES